jgi:hypothetical protein
MHKGVHIKPIMKTKKSFRDKDFMGSLEIFWDIVMEMVEPTILL